LIGVKKSLLGDERNSLGPLMRFKRGNVGTKSFHAKTATDLRISAKERAAVETAKNQSSRDFDAVRFSTFSTYRSKTDFP
jgi:hypothetical protein